MVYGNPHVTVKPFDMMGLSPLTRLIALLYTAAQWTPVQAGWQYSSPQNYPLIPESGPDPGSAYMVDNTKDHYHVAPDKGELHVPANEANQSLGNATGKSNGPVWPYSGSLKKYMANLADKTVIRGGYSNQSGTRTTQFNGGTVSASAASSYWLASLASLGIQPLAGGNDYQFFRDVTAFGADNTGKTDTTEAINAAICKPIVQLYYTQFVGDAKTPPTIKGCSTFEGIALIDTDPYIPGGSGSQWYIDQNQFFRQIRNFVFDLTDMPLSTAESDQPLVPTGIHWQVAQATSLQNLVFNMPKSSSSTAVNATTAVGIFTENGSGGFVSDLTFNGGSIGWRVGSQQFTARNLKHRDHGGAVGILTSKNGATAPNIVLDNTVFKNVAKIVQADGGSTLLSKNSNLWATGKRYNGSVGSTQTGDVVAPAKAKLLLGKNGKLFVRSRPQYEAPGTDSFLIATKDGGCKNDGTGDQTACINSFLLKAVGAKKIAYFPAGIYTVGGTVIIPTNSQVQGSSWSQIQGSGYYFGDMQHPQVVVQVGNKGDIGTMEIVEMLFSVKGSTAGAILMEWNTAAVTQGAAAMWDSHFRVGGGKGTDLDLDRCPKLSFNDNCIASTLMFHVTAQASGYFENVWAWVADHDNDASVYDQPDSSITQISIFGARGMFIESQGPSWFYGGGSEHSVLHNYLLSGAKSVFMGHIQTESPYFQPVPAAPVPFAAAPSFANDPDFSQCSVTADSISEQCRYAWGLRVIDSTDVTIHSAGLYSFFNEYYQDCIDTHNCQMRILEVKGSTGVVIYNLFTVATVNIATGIDGSQILQSDSNQHGFTTEVSVWLPLPGRDHDNIVYVGPDVFTNPTMSCSAPCVLVFPTSHLDAPTTISPSSYTTSFEYGTVATATRNGAPTAVFVTTTTTVVISIPPITVSGMPYSNFNITSKGPTPITIYPSVSVPPVTLKLPDGKGGTTSRVVPLPPWPLTTNPGGLGSSTTYHTAIFSTIVVTGPKVTTITFQPSIAAATFSCPATTELVFATPSITVRTSCTNSGLFTVNFGCPTTKVIGFLAATTASAQVDCTLLTLWSTGQAASSTETPLPTWYTWPLFGSIVPVTTSVSKPQPTDNGVVVSCAVWFFVFCISWGQIHIGAWVWALPPGIYPPGPPPIGLIQFPPGFHIEGKLPPWPQITIGRDKQLTTNKQPDCETKTAQACTTTTFFSATTTKNGATTTTLTSTSKHCETILGCFVRGSDSSATTTNVQFGTQTIAPVGSWPSEAWPAADQGAAYSSSVFAALSAALAAEEASAGGSVISFTPGPAASPTCASGTGCGGHLCTGFWCVPSPTGHPPAYQDPKDPSSGGFVAPTSTIGQTTTSTASVKPTTTTPPPPPPPTSTTSKPSPTFNPPTDEAFCDEQHPCDAWTCPPYGHTPYCQILGSPYTYICGCVKQFKMVVNGSDVQ
ncbi:pectin lyase fold/virulence factor [Podospora appendiculata]|uniref:Pectin lyase fold/virulence factor n=1 Tax=Podospora appendiculata TaxID=314037 RepID=A0AAE1CD44_9PEZI|nr:pectin lyase fold/virulence factor [Podospora appendiculata]